MPCFAFSAVRFLNIPRSLVIPFAYSSTLCLPVLLDSLSPLGSFLMRLHLWAVEGIVGARADCSPTIVKTIDRKGIVLQFTPFARPPMGLHPLPLSLQSLPSKSSICSPRLVLPWGPCPRAQRRRRDKLRASLLCPALHPLRRLSRGVLPRIRMRQGLTHGTGRCRLMRGGIPAPTAGSLSKRRGRLRACVAAACLLSGT